MAGNEQNQAEVEPEAQLGALSRTSSASLNSYELDMDSILSDVDSLLEDNAAAFVQNFVQKGGQ